ncbi:MAG: DUF58 domain-containing protein [Gemmataceae bacterium]|nr:DUF58 domain-containing protein [Gemmataceae bacterium]
MLTPRGWWFFVALLALLAAALATATATFVLVCLAALSWFLGQWAMFAVRLRRAHGRLEIHREIWDERAPLETLWARLPAEVRLTLESPVAFPFVWMVDRVPPLAQRVEGENATAGPVSAEQPLEMGYRIECPAPGLLRFEGVKLQVADLQGFFSKTLFVRDVRVVRVLPALADARGQIPAVKRHNLIPLPGGHPHRRAGTGHELLDVRDYLPGDPPKLIAWKASARRDRLMTKELESEVPVRCTMFVDLSHSVRIGAVGRNALARIVEITASVLQANAAVRDLTGVCLFDEAQVKAYLRPGRGSRHLYEITNLLTDAACLLPRTDDVPLGRLLPTAYGIVQDLYPDWLDPGVNYMPLWLPFWAAQPAYTMPRRIVPAKHWWSRGLRWLRRRLDDTPFGLRRGRASRFSVYYHRLYKARKQVAAVLAVLYDLGPGGLALLLEDDETCRRYVQRFLAEHQTPCPLPFYDDRGEYLFGSSGKIDVLADALLQAVYRGRDNELFVLLADFLEAGPHLEKLLRAVRVALARHHQVLVVCPWPPSVPMPQRKKVVGTLRVPSKSEGALRVPAEGDGTRSVPTTLQDWLGRASAARLHHAFTKVRQAFARLGVPVVLSAEHEAVGMVLHRLQRLRTLERGLR